jgi:hypothetical protein
MLYHVLSLPEVLILLLAVGITHRKLGVYGSTNSRIRKATTFRPSPIDWAVLLLMVAAVVAGLVAADWRAALFELRTVLLLPGLYYALLRSSALDEPTRWWILDALILGAVTVALIGLGQYVLGRNVVVAEGGLPRLQSVYTWAGYGPCWWPFSCGGKGGSAEGSTGWRWRR